MLKVATPPGIQYEGESYQQMCERDRRNREHNAAVDREIEQWKPWPMRALWPWCRKHAPQLLPPWADDE